MLTPAKLSLAAARLPDATVDNICRSPPLAKRLAALADRAFTAEHEHAPRAIVRGPLKGHEFYVELPKQKYFWLGTFEPWVQQAICDHLVPGSIAWDLGAFTGFHTLLLRKIAGKNNVVCVEPDPENRRLLTDNLRLNSYDDVLVVDTPVLGRAGMASLERHQDRPSMSRIRADDSGELAGVGLDDLLTSCPAPSLVKMDIEGMEGEVLEGARTLVHDVRPIWILEKHGDAGERAQSTLQAARYQLTRIDWWIPEAAQFGGGGGDHLLAVPA